MATSASSLQEELCGHQSQNSALVWKNWRRPQISLEPPIMRWLSYNLSMKTSRSIILNYSTIDGDEDLKRKQAVLDKHDDDITSLTVCLQTLLAPSKAPDAPAPDGRKLLTRKPTHLASGLSRINDMVSTPSDTPIKPSLVKHQEQF